MKGTLAAECLALATGLFPSRPPSAADVSRAQRLPDRIAREVRAFLKAPDSEQYKWERPPEQEKLRADLLSAVEKHEWQSDELPLELLPQWMLVIDGARKYAADKWPVYDAPDTLTPEVYELAPDELGDVWELVRAMDGVDAFFAELRAYVLSPEQVAAVAAAFPDYFEAMQSIVFDELTKHMAGKGKLDVNQEDMMRVLRQLGDETPIAVTAPAPAPKKAGGSPSAKSIELTRTSDQTSDLRSQQAK